MLKTYLPETLFLIRLQHEGYPSTGIRVTCPHTLCHFESWFPVRYQNGIGNLYGYIFERGLPVAPEYEPLKELPIQSWRVVWHGY